MTRELSLASFLALLLAACGSTSPSPGGGGTHDDAGTTTHADATSGGSMDATSGGGMDASSGGGMDATSGGGMDATSGGDMDAASGGGEDTGPHPTPGVCVPDPTGTGNSQNVGAYCTQGGNECQQYQFARFCSIDLDPMGSNFCIHLGCRDHMTCGEEACCTGRAGNPIHACVPKGCVAPDAGSACPPIP